MRDVNLSKMLWIGGVACFAFTAVLMSQLNSGETDRKAKSAACSESKRRYSNMATGPAHGEYRDDKASDAEQRKHDSLQYEALIDAAAACSAASSTNADLNWFYAALLRTLPSVIGILALVVAGLRYDADRRQMLGGRQIRLDITHDSGTNGWCVRNLGGGTQAIEGFDVLRFPENGVDRSVLNGLARLKEPRLVPPAGSISFESTFRGGDLLVAVLVRDVDENAVICWARFDSCGSEKRRKEEGRLL